MFLSCTFLLASLTEITVFWYMTPCSTFVRTFRRNLLSPFQGPKSVYPRDGSNKLLRKVKGKDKAVPVTGREDP
jgi:hypothetical protein